MTELFAAIIGLHHIGLKLAARFTTHQGDNAMANPPKAGVRK